MTQGKLVLDSFVNYSSYSGVIILVVIIAFVFGILLFYLYPEVKMKIIKP